MITTTIKNPKRVQKTHAQINEAAVKLIRKNGFDAMTMRDLSNSLNIAVGNLYAYIGSKDDVLFIVHKNASDVLVRSFEQFATDKRTPREILKRMIEVEFEIKSAIQDVVIVMYREAHHLKKAHLKEVLKRELWRLSEFERVIRAGIAEGQFRSVSPEAVAHCIVSVIDGWVLRRWTIQKKLTAEEMKTHILDMVFCQLDTLLPGSKTRSPARKAR